MITAKQQLLELTYRGAIDDHDVWTDIADAVADGMSWRSISDMLEERSGLRISYETLRQWHLERAAATT